MSDLREMYNTAISAINKIDERLDSATDAKGAGQRAYVNGLVKDQAESVTSILAQLKDHVDSLEPAARIGFVTGLKRDLDSSYKDEQTAFLEAWSKENVNDTPVEKLSAEEIETLEASRKDFYGRVKQILALADGFGSLEDDMVMPKKRTGSRGPRGPQKWSQYVYFIDGDEVEDDDNNITVLAKKFNLEKASALKELIASQMGDDWEPGKDFEINVAGVVFAGVFPADTVTEDSDSETESVTDSE